jgi:hypothetical protein
MLTVQEVLMLSLSIGRQMGTLQGLEVRLRQLANNDVVTNPSDFITKAEHARILDSRMASKDHESSGELARRAADADRQLSIRLKTQAAELAEVHTEAMSKLQRRHDAELAERTQRAQAHEQELQQAKRAVALAEEHLQSARDAQQRLQVNLIRAPITGNLSNCYKHHHTASRQAVGALHNNMQTARGSMEID